jgi:hypothetical protein
MGETQCLNLSKCCCVWCNAIMWWRTGWNRRVDVPVAELAGKCKYLICLTSLPATCRLGVKPPQLETEDVTLCCLVKTCRASPGWGWNKRVWSNSRIMIIGGGGGGWKPKNHREKMLQCHFHEKSHIKSPGSKYWWLRPSLSEETCESNCSATEKKPFRVYMRAQKSFLWLRDYPKWNGFCAADESRLCYERVLSCSQWRVFFNHVSLTNMINMKVSPLEGRTYEGTGKAEGLRT